MGSILAPPLRKFPDLVHGKLLLANNKGHRPLSLKIPNVEFDFDVKFSTLLFPLLKMYVDP